MRIAVDGRSLQEPQPSGVSWYAFFQLKALIAASPEHEIDVWIYDTGNPERSILIRRLEEECRNRSVSIRLWRYPQRIRSVGFVCGIFRSWKRFVPDCDVFWMPNLHFIPRTQPSCPVILTVHDVSFERFPQYMSWKGRIWHRSLHYVMRRASRMICVSESTERELRAVFPRHVFKTTVIYPGVPVYNSLLVRSPNAVATAPHIVCVSTIEPRKNIETCIDAFVRLKRDFPQAQCTLVGKEGYAGAAVIEAAQAAGILYTGYITEEEKVRLYADATLMVYPSIYEGFGLPPLEAQSYGVPVIAGAHTALPEVLGQSAVLCDMNDVRSLENAMHALTTDNRLRDTYIQKGRENVKRFSWDRSAQQLKYVIESFL